MKTIQYMRRAEARQATARRQQATVSGADAWGKLHQWLIEWQAEEVHADRAQENIGRVGVIWADWCPVVARRNPNGGGVSLISNPVAVASTFEEIHLCSRVEAEEDMAPGTWRIVSEL